MILSSRRQTISQYFNLGRTQAELDFVDVDVDGDTKVFLSPTAIRLMETQWSAQCVSLIQSFFQEVLDAIKQGNDARAERLLRSLREPNETHLGLSSGKPRGRALGTQSARAIWNSLRQSAAVKTGLLTDLEETVLMIDDIGPDIVSDITTNIIRGPLITYTQEACHYYGIPTQSLDSGPMWDPIARDWNNSYKDLPIANDSKLLLVPKSIVRRHPVYDSNHYTRHYLLEYLKRIEEQKPNSDLVKVLKDGTRKVYKYRVSERYGFDADPKKAIVRETLKAPRLLDQYRQDREKNSPPLTHDEIAGAAHVPPPNWDELLKAVNDIPPGPKGASDYERAIEGLLTALFYPSLVHPQRQRRVNGGRKVIDITYSTRGNGTDFFAWLIKHFPSAYTAVECKNYKNEVGNPELDQLIARFNPTRGKVGILVCRKIEDRKLLDSRCRDAAKDGQGFIIALDDSDLAKLVEAAKVQRLFRNDFELLRQKFDHLTS